jgi:hypothetical protein
MGICNKAHLGAAYESRSMRDQSRGLVLVGPAGSLVSGGWAAYRFPSYFAEQRMEQRRGSDDGAPVAGALVDAPVNLTDDSNLATAAG